MANPKNSDGLDRRNALQVDGLVYNLVKTRNPSILMDVFSKDKCRELEKRDHLYSADSLALTLFKLRRDRKKLAARKAQRKPKSRAKEAELEQDDTAKSKAPVDRTYNHDLMHRSFCRLSDPQTSLNLTICNYFFLAGEHKALEFLFDDKTRKEYGTTMKKMDVPTVLRMVAHRKWEVARALSTNKNYPEIFKCQFCKKELKGPQTNLVNHIGLHEEIPQYCFVEGCDKYCKLYTSLRLHLMTVHQLQVIDLTAEQYHQLHSMKIAYFGKAAQFLDRYFPPESFIGFSDRKKHSTAELEDTKCVECEKIVKATMSRRLHVAAHLNLSFKCVFEGCEARTNPPNCSSHLKQKHSMKASQLGVMELAKYKKMKLDFARVMKEEVPKYFPRK